MASKGGGRKRDLVWNDVSHVEGENTQVECNYCGVKVIKKIERVKTHHSKCSKKIKLDKQVQTTVKEKQKLDMQMARFFK